AAVAPSRGTPPSGSSDPIQPVVVKTIMVRAGSVQSAALSPLVVPAPQSTVPPTHWTQRVTGEPQQPAASVHVAVGAPPPPGRAPGVLGTLTVRAPAAPAAATAPAAPAISTAPAAPAISTAPAAPVAPVAVA